MKYLFIYYSLIYRNNLIESTDTSSTSNTSESSDSSPTLFSATPNYGSSSTNIRGSSHGNGSSATPPGSSSGDCASKSNSSDPVIKLFQKDPSDPNKNVEMDPSNYTVTNDVKHTTYKFKENVLCSIVICNDVEVWKTNKNDISSPKFVTYYIDWHNRIAIGDGKKAVFYQFDNSEWKYLSTIAYKTEGKSDELVVNYGGQCFNYKKGSDGKWSYDEAGETPNVASPEAIGTDQSTPRPGSTHTSGNTSGGTVTVQTKTSQSTPTVLNFDEYHKYIKFFKADPKDANTTVELNNSEYTYKFSAEGHAYGFNEGVNCNLLKIKGKDVWKYDSSKHNGKYPKGMGIQEDTVLILFEEPCEVYVKNGEEWVYDEILTVALNLLCNDD
ncbi:hypothetical protein MACK_000462 [Theileria orientalis]|uniref:Uncharacterized protein n=1 Tax=Theileria orientalis TaxID=68886 RepID=A0A976M9W2_THEOR|nr:hypothetical protein MACK_000462 [Theileria orientalis]